MPRRIFGAVNVSLARQAYHEKLLTQFWIEMKDSHPKTTKKLCAFLFLICMSKCLCETKFSTLLQIKTEQINRLDVEDDLRCALSQTIPRIQLLSDDKTQVLH